MSTTISTTRLPSCPTYCDGRHGDSGFDFEIETGQEVRCHSGSMWRPGVRGESTDPTSLAELWVGTEEVRGAGLRPSRVGLCADDVNLSPENARRFAQYLLEAADVAEEANRRAAEQNGGQS